MGHYLLSDEMRKVPQLQLRERRNIRMKLVKITRARRDIGFISKLHWPFNIPPSFRDYSSSVFRKKRDYSLVIERFLGFKNKSPLSCCR